MQPDGKNEYWRPDKEQSLETTDAVPSPSDSSNQLVSWQASEYVHHEKQGLWFVGLFGGALVLLILSVLLLGSYTFAILIVVMTITLAFFAVRPPRIMSYSIDSKGLQINDRQFSYHDFRAFGVLEDGPLLSALLVPNKRFMPLITIYFPPENGDEIIDLLGSHLPMQHVEPDLVDNLVRRLRF